LGQERKVMERGKEGHGPAGKRLESGRRRTTYKNEAVIGHTIYDV
jgi:hypothetical protein